MTTKRPKSGPETEAEIVAGIERGLADVAAGRTVSHDEAMATLRAVIEATESKNAKTLADPEFAAECARQSALVAEADRGDPDLEAFLDAALNDIEGWT